MSRLYQAAVVTLSFAVLLTALTGSMGQTPIVHREPKAQIPAAKLLKVLGKSADEVITALGKPVADKGDGSWRCMYFPRRGFKQFVVKVRDSNAIESEQRKRPEQAFITADAAGSRSDEAVFECFGIDKAQWKLKTTVDGQDHTYTHERYALRIYTSVSSPGKPPHTRATLGLRAD